MRQTPTAAPLLLTLLLGLAAPAAAQAPTPAERASRQLDRALARDELRDDARDARDQARGLPAPTAERVQDLNEDRGGIRPDVGRGEQAGRLPDVQRSLGSDTNIQR